MTQKLYLLLIGCIFTIFLKAQQPIFTHYSLEDGLSENTVMGILQDRKGMMWFATWNGLNKFDGYTFTTYKASFNNGITLTSNRIDKIMEDRYGFLWLLTYDHQAFRFDPTTEHFEHISTGKGIGNTTISQLVLLPDGAVWLLTDNEGGIRVTTNPQTLEVRKKWYVHQKGAKIYDIFQDKTGNEWILSNKGLSKILQNDLLENGFSEKPSHIVLPKAGFYSAFETSSELFFGSDNGQIWCFRKSFKDFIRYQLPLRSSVTAIRPVGKHKIAFITKNAGFCVRNLSDQSMDIVTGNRLPNAPVYDAFVDRYENIWLNQGLAGTIVHYNTQKKKLQIETVPTKLTEGGDKAYPYFHINGDASGKIWIHPYGGIFSFYDPQIDRLRPFRDETKNEAEQSFLDKISRAYSDRQGNLWLASRLKGIAKVTFRKQQFSLITPTQDESEAPANNIRALGEDNSGHIFVGSKDGRLRVYDLDYNYLGYMTTSGTVEKSGKPLGGNVYYLLNDRTNTLWIATKGAGIFKAEPKGNLTYKLTHFTHNPADKYSLSNNYVYCLYEDYRGRIWVATYGGGLNYIEKNINGREQFINAVNRMHSFPLQSCSKTRFVTGDHSHNIWIGTTRGVLRLDAGFKQPEQIRFSHYTRESGNPSSLSNNDVHWILPTSNHELYFATYGGGLSKLIRLLPDGKASFTSYTTENGLSSDILLSLCEDRKGYLWIGTENGISRFSPSHKNFDNYTGTYLNLPAQLNEACVLYTSSGKILFGTDNGFIAFDPEKVHKSRFSPSIILSRLLIANEEVTPGNSSFLQRTLDNTSVLKLPHDKNIFTIQYAALDYSNPAEVRYAYRLKGFDEKWNYVGKQRTATYTNLPKGTYVFEVRSTNADGVWCNNVRSIVIERLPSFWETGWAYTLYIIGFLLVTGSAFYILFTIYRLKHKVQMEKQVTEMKLRFFTDISHELRTPLVLISGPIEYILKKKPLSDDLRKQLQVVERNTNRMLRLINQLLDFRKLQNKKMQLRVQRFNCVAWTKDILESFYSSAEEHHIRLEFETSSSSIFLWADKDKYEKIVLNLLSNAFKYTPDGKQIKLYVGEMEKTVFVSVADQGIGIDKSKQQSVFQRFENMADKDLFNHSSTGIGLSVAKNLADMHHATITVESAVGKGSCFRVDFPKGKAHFDKSVEFLMDDDVPKAEPEIEIPVSREPDNEQRQTMLVVEDNSELRSFLRSVFAPDYNLIEAADGEEGLRKAIEKMPDIIISDIMMPVKDGIKMLKELRGNRSVSHIPVILLTAKASIDNRIEGLKYGADDYITKPFSVAYLSARVKNLLERRQQQQELFRQKIENDNYSHTSGKQTPSKDAPVSMTEEDRKFIETFAALVRRDLNKGDLEIESFARELAVSRSVFFKKVKTLLGVAPIEFVRDMRIKKASELIKSGNYSMADIAYMVGFNDPHYFSKTFKLKTGMSPSEYQRRNA